ncbi:MAG: PAS domain S-box protein [Actinomycetota bacterium]|nr:PAS domain S-box protein [Actinomycetota bacterium]
MRVLVVDDDEAGRYLVASILKSAGHEVIEAGDGLEALEKGREEMPDVVISDILMPRMDGYQLAREWKSDEALARIPLVFLTASYTDPADEKFAAGLGADGFLSKPVEPETLLETIDALMSTSEEVRAPAMREEAEVLREYSERLVHKLEEKLIDLERTNAILQSTMQTLSEEVDAKARVIHELDEEVAQRRQREKELRAERDFSRRIIEAADVFVGVADAEGRLTLFNPGAERITGYTAEEVLGARASEALYPSDEPTPELDIFSSVDNAGPALRGVSPVITKSGDELILEWSVVRLPGEGGGLAGTLAIGIDVTEVTISAAVERALGHVDLAILLGATEEQVLQVACSDAAHELGSTAAWIAYSGPGGEPEIKACAGCTREAIEGLLDSGRADGDGLTRAALRERGAVAIAGLEKDLSASWKERAAALGIRSGCAFPLRRTDRVFGALALTSANPHAFDGVRFEAAARYADRVAMALMAVEAREEAVLLSAAVESAASAIVVCNAAGTVSWVNPAFTVLTGYELDDVAGSSIFGPDDGAYREPDYESAWQRVLNGSVWRAENSNTRKDGTPYAEDVTIAPVSSPTGGVHHVVIVKQDVSERQRLDQMKTDFISMVSHELRTPLTSIIGFSDLLAAMDPTERPEQVHSSVEKIRTNGRRMLELVETLLEATEVESEGMALVKQPTDLGALVSERVTGLPPVGFSVRLDVQDGMPEVMCDPARVSNALDRLLDNAVKYSPRGGDIVVSVEAVGEAARISVQDHGIGMSEEEAAGLFELFAQGDMSSTRSFGGMGLGLFVAYRGVAAHGGTILVQSVPGEGSTFTIEIPMS